MSAKFIYVKKVDRTTKKLKKQLRNKFIDVKTKTIYKPQSFTIDKELVKYFVEEYKLKAQAEKQFRDNTITPDEFLKG